MTDREELMAALGATAESMGQTATPIALNIMADDLEDYAESDIATALKTLRRKNERFCVASILKYIQASDGRPSPDKAWAMMPKSEYETGVVTTEMMSAWFVAVDQYESGDEIGAQIAFKREYALLVDQSRDDGKAGKWEISLGFDKDGRSGPVVDAVRQGLIASETAERRLAGNVEALEELLQVVGTLALESSRQALAIENSGDSGKTARLVVEAAKLNPEEAKKRLEEIRQELLKQS